MIQPPYPSAQSNNNHNPNPSMYRRSPHAVNFESTNQQLNYSQSPPQRDLRQRDYSPSNYQQTPFYGQGGYDRMQRSHSQRHVGMQNYRGGFTPASNDQSFNRGATASHFNAGTHHSHPYDQYYDGEDYDYGYDQYPRDQGHRQNAGYPYRGYQEAEQFGRRPNQQQYGAYGNSQSAYYRDSHYPQSRGQHQQLTHYRHMGSGHRGPSPQRPPYNKQPISREVFYEEEPLRIPDPVRHIEYVPHLNRYVDYVEEKVTVPVEKYYTDYYEIEHVTDFVPREYEDSVVEMVPEEVIRYRLEYVPVEQKIVHLPKKDLYDANGLYKGVGHLMDIRPDLNSMLGNGIKKQIQAQGQQQINQALYNNLAQSQAEQGAIKNLEESLVGAMNDQINRSSRVKNQSEQQINSALYQNLSNSVAKQNAEEQQLNQAVYQNLSQQLINSNVQRVNSAIPRQNNNFGFQNSRKRTNFVTSDNYFPTYEEEMRELRNIGSLNDEYFSQNYAQNTANRFNQGDQAAYGLANALGGGASQGQAQGNNAAMNLAGLFTVPGGAPNGPQGQANNAAMNLGSLFTVPGGQQGGYNSQSNPTASGHQATHRLADTLLNQSQTSGY